MFWTTYTVYNFADDLHWPELGILLESIDYHEAARKASFLGSMCEDPFMATIHFERRFDALMKYFINVRNIPLERSKFSFIESNFKLEVPLPRNHIFFSGLKIYPRISVVTLVMF